MNNPWAKFNKTTSPYVLEADRQIIDEHNCNRGTCDNHKIHTDLYPEPFLGMPNANVVLLNLNPGFNDYDIDFHQNDNYFIEQARKNLIHQSNYGFYLLDPKIKESPGHKWWYMRLRTLIESCGLEKVAQNIFCVELFPYHSVKFKEMDEIESQQYSFHLVNKAIKRNAVIILMRGSRQWLEAVQDLKAHDCDRYFSLNNPRCAYITERNLPEGKFKLVEETIKNNRK